MLDVAYNVLFVDTFNSTCSILAERLLGTMSNGRFRGFSAGTHPTGRIHPLTLGTLRGLGVPVTGLHCKSIDEFLKPDAPEMDFIFTVGEANLRTAPPRWRGQPWTADWTMLDPASVDRNAFAAEQAFRNAAVVLRRRIELMLAIPAERLESLSASTDMGVA